MRPAVAVAVEKLENHTYTYTCTCIYMLVSAVWRNSSLTRAYGPETLIVIPLMVLAQQKFSTISAKTRRTRQASLAALI